MTRGRTPKGLLSQIERLACRNLNYWDSVSTLAGEVPMPHKTFPRALCGAVVLVVLTYALPLMVGLGVTKTVAGHWKLGYFAEVAKQVPPHLKELGRVPCRSELLPVKMMKSVVK